MGDADGARSNLLDGVMHEAVSTQARPDDNSVEAIHPVAYLLNSLLHLCLHMGLGM